MKKFTLLLIGILVSNTLFSQAIYKSLYSEILDTERDLKILLPRNYSNNDKKAYPVIYVFDGDYMFETVAGSVDYYSYWDDMPNAIVVGVNQQSFREADLEYSDQDGLPVNEGTEFFEFVGKELIPFVNKTFKTENFKVAVGHGKTANFINYYLIREQPIFNGYITISPDFSEKMPQYITDVAKSLGSKVFYYVATSTNDIDFIKEKTIAFNTTLRTIENTNFLYDYYMFKGPSHYSLPAHVIPSALEHIFFAYRPISKKEYTSSILKLTSSPVEYLEDKYATIEELFGIKKQIVINDFKAIAAAISEKEQWNYFENLAKIARKQYPETLLSNYYLGQYYEKTNAIKKAIKVYKDAYIMEEIAGLSKDDMLAKAEALQAGN